MQYYRKTTDALYVIKRTVAQRSKYVICTMNEKNISYGNGDILPMRSINMQFKTCSEAYEQELTRMIETRSIILWELKQDVKALDELIFDMNSVLWNHGAVMTI